MTTHTAPANLSRILGPDATAADDAAELAEASARAAIRDQQRADAAARQAERAAMGIVLDGDSEREEHP